MAHSLKRIVILMSDTGGGHRSAAEAIADGLRRQYPECYDVRLVDVIRQAAMFPSTTCPTGICRPYLRRTLVGVGFHATNTPRMARLYDPCLRLMMARRLKKLLSQLEPDLSSASIRCSPHCPARFSARSLDLKRPLSSW